MTRGLLSITRFEVCFLPSLWSCSLLWQVLLPRHKFEQLSLIWSLRKRQVWTIFKRAFSRIKGLLSVKLFVKKWLECATGWCGWGTSYSTLISLIPKIQAPMSFKHFRPIALYSMIHKASTDPLLSNSGQKINREKTRVFFSRNVPAGARRQLSQSLRVLKMDDLENYLGSPLIHSCVTRRTY